MEWEPRVWVVRQQNSANYYLRYIQPNGKPKQISSRTKNKRDAHRKATALEEKLKSEAGLLAIGKEFQEIADLFFERVKKSQSKSEKRLFNDTRDKFLNFIDEQFNFKIFRITDVSSRLVTDFKFWMMDQTKEIGPKENQRIEKKYSPSTIAGHIRRLKTFCNWCTKNSYIKETIYVDNIKINTAEQSGGRALAEKEILAIIDAAEKILESTKAKSWNFFIRGLEYSGLRIDEAYRLTWDGNEEEIRIVDIETETPCFEFPRQKGTSERRLHPILPKMVNLLRTVTKGKRNGYVFSPVGIKGKILECVDTVQDYIHKFTKRANIITKKRYDGQIKYASAHDLKRTFAFNNSQFLNEKVLQSATRHASASCLQVFYLKADAKSKSKQIQDELGVRIEKE